MNGLHHPDQTLSVSIIIPALNEQKLISKCLEAITRLNFPSNQYETILVDNGSEDQTVKIAQSFRVTVLSKTDGTIASLRNFGVKHAKGKILGFVDADCVVPANWMKDGIKYFVDPGVGAAGSRLKHDASTWIGKSWSLIHAQKMHRGETDWLPSGNMFVSKKAFDEVGGFDEQLTTSEDVELCRKLRSKGYKIVSDPQISSVHLDPPKTLLQFYRKELWHGQNMLKSLSKEGSILSRAFFYAFFCLICMIGILGGAITGLITGNYVALAISFAAILIAPFVLSLRTIIRHGDYGHLVGLTLTYLVYGVARAICLAGLSKHRKKVNTL